MDCMRIMKSFPKCSFGVITNYRWQMERVLFYLERLGVTSLPYLNRYYSRSIDVEEGKPDWCGSECITT